MQCMEIQTGERLTPAQRTRPEPAPGEVLIRIHAAGVNRPDLLQVAGHYPPPPGASDIPGLECAGVIEAVGKGVVDWAVGARVCALLTGGGYGKFATAPAGQCLPIPQGLDFIQAASLPETYFTVWSNVMDRGGLQAGESLLVHGGTSGIGVAAIQIAKAHGARVMVTAGSEEKCQACRDCGADLAVNYKTQDFVPAAQSFGRGGAGVNVVLDMVGGDYVARNLDALAPEGRHVSIAVLRGAKAEVDIFKIMVKRLTITGSTLRARDPAFKADIARALQSHVWPKLESGEIRPVVHATFALKDANQALDLMRQGAHIGKIVLEVA